MMLNFLNLLIKIWVFVFSPSTPFILQGAAIFRSSSDQVNNLGNTTGEYRLNAIRTDRIRRQHSHKWRKAQVFFLKSIKDFKISKKNLRNTWTLLCHNYCSMRMSKHFTRKSIYNYDMIMSSCIYWEISEIS